MSSVFAIRQRAGESESRTLPRAARTLLIVLSAGCALVLVVRFVASPLLTVRHVVVDSDVGLVESQVLSLSGLQGDERYYALPVELLKRKLEASPLIRRAVVQKVFPDTLRLTVWGRQPAALLLAQADGKTLPVLVDGEGVLFKVGTSGGDLDVPVISGISVGSARIGQRLSAAYVGLLADLQALRDRAPTLFRLISEVRVVPVSAGPVPLSAQAGASSLDPAALASTASVPAAAPGVSTGAATASSTAGPEDDAIETPAGFDLLLYLTSSPVPVLVHGDIDQSLVKYTLMVMDLLSKQGVLKDIQALDFRSGNVVYRMKERRTPLMGR